MNVTLVGIAMLVNPLEEKAAKPIFPTDVDREMLVRAEFAGENIHF